MIVVDTSALMAVLQGEPMAEGCSDALAENDLLLIAAPTLTEAIIVAGSQGLSGDLAHLLDGLPFEVLPLRSVPVLRDGTI